jgi:hypothetical protein
MPTPLTALRIPDREKAELQKLAAAQGMTLSQAFREGARLLLESKEEAKKAA